ncbi:lipoprotein [gut metagenome]|uniref:Lipoprotein n=1 Tax=gut metagenome TaxID=749906 RepID=J9FUH0_9ZZZZ
MKLKYICMMAAALSLTSCNDSFLERGPQDLNDQSYWVSVNDLKTYANAFYSLIPGGVSVLDDTDSDNQVPNGINTFLWGQYVVPTEGGVWGKGNWQNIRQINYFMTHYQQVQGSEADINLYVAEMRFFRALEYFNKIKALGDVPWLDKDLNVDSPELYGPKMKRNQVFAKIIEDLDFAIHWLPEDGSEEANRLNKDIARHVKARFCLNEGTHYKYHTELGYDGEANQWLKMAADESDALIQSGKYEIYKTGKPNEDYFNLYRIDDKSNLKEAVLYVDYKADIREHNMAAASREAGCGFSKDFVESFLCSDGLPISLSEKYQGDADIRKETANRDPRLKQQILTYDFPTNVSDDLKDSTFVSSEEEFITQHCFTGYRPIKGFNPIYSQALYMKSAFDGIAYRYAETLLINAEAKAELGTLTQADLDKTINELRDRVGMPHLTLAVGFNDPKWPNWGYSLSPVLQEIRRERRIELAGEGFRFDDLKRWKAGQLLNNVMTYVGKRKPDGTLAIVYPNYTNPDLSYEAGKSRTWEDKMYLYPIPTGELQRNPELLPQNPGW